MRLHFENSQNGIKLFLINNAETVMTGKSGENSFALGFLELLFLIGMAVLLPLVLDYPITELYPSPVLGWNFIRVFVASCV